MRICSSLMVALFALAGCETGGSLLSTDVDPATPPADLSMADGRTADTVWDLLVPDLVDEPGDGRFETTPDVPFVECEPGTGCFLDPCGSNNDCQSSYCVEHLGAGVCTQACQDECPPGWSCQQVAGTEPDVVFICVSDHANLCKPCSGAADCKSIGGVDDACLDYQDEGSYCGGNCADDGDCPWGFSCVEAQAQSGAVLMQCVADTGQCPCTAKSVALGLATPCQRENEFGSCSGQRVCQETGLSACDAPLPGAESCNGIDDDCDGEVDEPGYLEGTYLSLCDDDNDCTQDLCNGEDGCQHEILDAGECKDGDPCTVGDHCENGVCLGSPVLCDDNNPCTDDACDGLGGCSFSPNAADCDDGQPCTVGDSCKAGLCVGVEVNCQCQNDLDCQPLEDGDLCNGVLYCNTEAIPYQCQIVPDSPIACPPPPADAHALCLAAHCAPETGECSWVPANQGYACSDSNACTLGDSCMDGLCTPAGSMPCDDANPCTTDSCQPDSGCSFVPANGPCDDGLVCTTGDQCVAGKCVAGPPLDCDDSNPCTKDLCGPDGCTHDALSGACDDGNSCTLNDSCANGQCVPGQMLDCNDGNPCTTDSCTDQGVCLHAATAGACDDGNSCTVGDSCVNGQCGHSGLLSCDDGNVCTSDSCDPDSGCIHQLNQAPCNDNDVCTTNDHCHLGECLGGGELVCNDANPCTDDSCQSGVGCLFTPNESPCDDGSVCSLNDLCKNGWCLPGPPLACNDDNLCTTDTCDPDSGCTFSPNTLPCDDGDACTTSDACLLGQCAGGDALDCQDNNPCTDDACLPESGCVHTPNVAACDDGNLCTLGDTCSAGACIPGNQAPVCNDNKVCTDDACVPEFGCVYINNTAACDDANTCTENDACANGECLPGAPLNCPDDNNTCTTDSCHEVQGCLHTPVPDCCGNGIKEGAEVCDDGNQVDGDGCSANCLANGIFAFGEYRPELKCADFQNLGPSYLKFCFTLKGQTLCTGQHDNGNVQCFDEANGIRFLYDLAATWPMRFTKGTQDCRNYHPSYLKNFANAIGYANFQILQQKTGNSCERTWINDAGVYQETSGDSSANLPYEIRYWN